MKLAILVCTEGRPAFLPWLAWNIRKQKGVRPIDTIVCVASSDRATATLLQMELPGFHSMHVDCAPDEPVPVKRNKLLRAAAEVWAEFFAWMDDDDWHSPTRLSVALQQLEASDGLCMVSFSGPLPYLALESLRWCEVVSMRREAIPITVVGRVRTAGQVPFVEEQYYASDATWLRDLYAASMTRVCIREPSPAFFAVRHPDNMSRHTGSFRYELPLVELKALCRTVPWQDTTQQLAALQERVRA